MLRAINQIIEHRVDNRIDVKIKESTQSLKKMMYKQMSIFEKQIKDEITNKLGRIKDKDIDKEASDTARSKPSMNPFLSTGTGIKKPTDLSPVSISLDKSRSSIVLKNNLNTTKNKKVITLAPVLANGEKNHIAKNIKIVTAELPSKYVGRIQKEMSRNNIHTRGSMSSLSNKNTQKSDKRK